MLHTVFHVLDVIKPQQRPIPRLVTAVRKWQEAVWVHPCCLDCPSVVCCSAVVSCVPVL